MVYGPFWTINVYHLVAQDCVEPESKSPGRWPSQFCICTEYKVINLLVREDILPVSPIQIKKKALLQPPNHESPGLYTE